MILKFAFVALSFAACQLLCSAQVLLTMEDAVCRKTELGKEWVKSCKAELKHGILYRLSGKIKTEDFECVNHADLGGPQIIVAYLNSSGALVGSARSSCVTGTEGGFANVSTLVELPKNAVASELRMIVPSYVRGTVTFADVKLSSYSLPKVPEPTPSPSPMIDEYGRFKLGGKKVFPLGMYFENWDPFTVSNLTIFADSPFNCIVPYHFPDKSQMDLCASKGLGVLYNANVYYGTRWAFGKVSNEAEDDVWTLKTVKKFKDHPALWGWYINDEFGLDMLERLDRRYELVKKIDPVHPTWGVFMNPKFAQYFGANLDVLGVDPYPVAAQGNRKEVDFSRCASEPRAAIDEFGGKRPLWSVIQAFDWKMYCPSAKNTRMPTETDLRTMTWQEIASGANGLFYLAFTSLAYEGNGGNFKKHWDALRRVASEVKEKESLLLSDPGVAFDRPPMPIVARTWKVGDKDIALVVNSSHTNVKAQIVFDSCEALNVSLPPLAHKFYNLKPKSGPIVKRFANIDLAQKYIRQLKKKNDGRLPKGGVVAEIESGEFTRERPFHLTDGDSGEKDAPVIYRALKRGKTILSGAWKAHWEMKDGLLTAKLPQDIEPIPSFFACGLGSTWNSERPLSLYAASRRLPLARWPNTGRHSIGDDETRLRRFVPRSPGQKASTNGWFTCDMPRMELWAKEPDLWAHGWWVFEWADTISKVLEVKPDKHRMQINTEHVGFGVNDMGAFFVLNARCEMDEPGEWMLDRAARMLYVKPIADGAMPVVARSVAVLTADKAHDIAFEGFVFECARGGGVIDLISCERVDIRASVVRHASGWGYRTAKCRACRVEGCDFYDLGEGGLLVDGGDYKTMEAGGNTVDNCHITDYGRYISCYRPGIRLDGVGNRATHNLIHHGEHQGIAFFGDNHYIGYNVLHDLCSATDDAGAIYAFIWEKDKHEGTVIEHNLVNETGRHPDCGCNNGIYLDNVTSGVTVQYNVINRARHAITSNAARNRFIGNVCINSRLPWTRGDASKLPAKVPSVGCVISNNIAIACGPPRYTATNTFSLALGGNLETKVDPGFVDYFGFDWDAKPGSEMAKIVGDLKMRQAGLKADRWRVSPAVRLGRNATRPRQFEGSGEGPEVRVDAGVDGELPAGIKEFAVDVSHGEFAGWGKGRVIWTVPGGVTTYATTQWKEYSLFFTPQYDTTGNFSFMGGLDKDVFTEYELVEIIGAEIISGAPKATVCTNARRPYRVGLRFKKNVPVVIVYRARIPEKK
ncbi:MAG: right-handed parallel beta-helix repeat-containing protein [Kiritimatiellae bacterium]|nr:right-handed parallel beta-helix repeat-containing protein [Kiritimatiellia bacterium]